MDNFFDKFRSGAGKTAFEADKLRRVTAIQGTVRSLKGDFEKEFYQVGRVAFMLHQKQQISQPELQQACNRLVDIQSQIQAREREIEQIRAEAYETSANIGQTRYGHLCPNGHGPIPPQDSFCQKCGARAIEVPPPTGRQCPHCGAALSAEARFCASCGKAAAPVPFSPPLVENPCPACGAALLPEAIFCAECGHRLEISSSESPLTDASTESVDIFADSGVVEPLAPPEKQLFTNSDDFNFEAAVVGEEEVTAVLETEETAAWMGMVEEEDVKETAVVLEKEDTQPEEDLNLEKMAVEEVVCPVCQAALLPEAMFCAECGYRLAG